MITEESDPNRIEDVENENRPKTPGNKMTLKYAKMCFLWPRIVTNATVCIVTH